MMAKKFCTECGKELIPGNRFCINCGNKILDEWPTTVSNQIKEEILEAKDFSKQEEKRLSETIVNRVEAIGQIIGNTSFASAVGGEMVFTQNIPSTNSVLSTIGPLKYLLNGILSIFKNFKGIFRDKKRLIPAIIMTIIWIVLIILPTLGVAGTPMRYLYFLTFARGGMGQGLSKLIGGTLGKGLFAYFVTSLITPIFSGKKPFKGIGGGIKTLFNSFAVKDIRGLSPISLGGGLALIAYNFLTGSAIIQNSMIGIVGFIMGLRGLSRKTGFLRGFIISFAKKSSKNKHVDSYYINKIIAGVTTGFALSIPLSTIGFSYICYVIGVFLIGVAIILKIIVGKKKGVENA